MLGGQIVVVADTAIDSRAPAYIIVVQKVLQRKTMGPVGANTPVFTLEY